MSNRHQQQISITPCYQDLPNGDFCGVKITDRTKQMCDSCYRRMKTSKPALYQCPLWYEGVQCPEFYQGHGGVCHPCFEHGWKSINDFVNMQQEDMWDRWIPEHMRVHLESQAALATNDPQPSTSGRQGDMQLQEFSTYEHYTSGAQASSAYNNPQSPTSGQQRGEVSVAQYDDTAVNRDFKISKTHKSNDTKLKCAQALKFRIDAHNKRRGIIRCEELATGTNGYCNNPTHRWENSPIGLRPIKLEDKVDACQQRMKGKNNRTTYCKSEIVPGERFCRDIAHCEENKDIPQLLITDRGKRPRRE
ncbi:hypothetical protein SBOR_9768 [Sclerotinia borealis F-4128]|uniref:Uncharacterized protein n=1 Tax=Sclerotinia borealis (strain F-4128) TaxID=1432307 RepID=W9C5N3_SCLBF|nr:hypothetical protein SBOR_9768 [Sclerotinia borealis F-4128]